jgi:16S rRNA (cytosine967-C5)-methyltransferase
MISAARAAAYDALLAVAAGRADLPAALARSRRATGDRRDQTLAAEIALGVERRRATLDYLIAHVSTVPPERLDLEVLTILRMSVFQLLHLTRVPASAVVDEGVKLTRRAGKASAARLVNAVLRTISRNRSRLALPARPVDEANRDAALDYLSITLSHPRWLAARWYDRLGFAIAGRWMAFNNAAAPLTLRANRIRTTPGALAIHLAAQGIAVAPGQYAPDALIVGAGQPMPPEDGSFVMQDEASQLVPLLAGPRPGPGVLDTCAAPGGKTTALAAVASGLVVACDVRDRRLALLRRTISAAGASRVVLVQADLLHPLPFRAVFGCVVVDAPCSGLGTLRRDPDIRWRRTEADLARFAEDQQRMIAHAADVVAPGGRLVYATCSSEPEENESVVDAFLRTRPGFAPVDARHAHPDLPPAVVDERGHLRTSPDRHGLEVFFGAVFERRRAL